MPLPGLDLFVGGGADGAKLDVNAPAKFGFLYGETAPERPCLVTRDAVTVTNLHATIMHLMGISPKTAFDVERRPFYITEDGKGEPVFDLMA